MKMLTLASFIFSMRTFAAALLALFFSYQLDLTRPTWAFITVYIISAPVLGMARSKGLYRMCGTICGAVFSVAVIPTLIDASELLVLAIALWIASCLYISIVDGTPRAYAFLLSGYTTALIGFPSVTNPQAIFDTALSRTEEIGLAIGCVQLLGYLPFNQRAGHILQRRIDQWLLDARQWAIDIMTFTEEDVLIADRSQLMVDAVSLDALRVHAHYDTPHFRDIENWVIQLQRHIQDFFADLVTLEAQIKTLRATDRPSLARLQPLLDSYLNWVKAGGNAIPQGLWSLLKDAVHDNSMHGLIKSGVMDTFADLMTRRSESLILREKIAHGVKAEHSHVPLARHVDHRQAAIYGLTIAGLVMIMSTFWILTGWPDGGTATMLATVICCFFASLEAPPKAAFMFLTMSVIGSLIGWGYNFVVFPHIDGFVLLAYALSISCIPIGIIMNNPSLTGIMLPVVLGINIASFQNRFDADITVFFNGFIAQTIGIVAGGAALTFVRALSLQGATSRLLTENGKALATLAAGEFIRDTSIIDRIAHRAGMAFIRAPGLREARDQVVKRILLDLQAARALIQIKALLPKITPDLQQSLQVICSKIATHFSVRRGLHDPAPTVCDDIHSLTQKIDLNSASYDAMHLIGLMKTLSRGLGKEAV